MASTSTRDGTSTVPSLRSPGLWVALLAGAVVAVYAVATGGNDSSNPSVPKPAGTVRFSETSRNHVQGTVHYDPTPPAGGDHNPIWLTCVVYHLPAGDQNVVP